jgi:hypothetical protein
MKQCGADAWFPGLNRSRVTFDDGRQALCPSFWTDRSVS